MSTSESDSTESELPATTIDPYKLCEQGARMAGKLPVSALGRAADLLVSDQGYISAVLVFGRDEENRRIVRGELEARIQVTCQRCLEPMEEQVESRFELAVVSDDDSARQVPSHYEPLQTGPAGGLKVRELVEDELLLAMAPFPMHRPEDCKLDPETLGQTEEQPDSSAGEGRNKRPFELLEGLLKSKKDDSSTH